MRNIPVDAEAFRSMVLSAVEVVPDLDFDTKEQKTSPDGSPLWQIRLLTRDGEDTARRPEVTTVKVAAVAEPKVVPGVVPSFGGLVGLVWSGDNGGGVSLRADSVAMDAKPSTRDNGQVSKPEPVKA